MTTCTAEQQLRRAAYAFQQMKGRGQYDMGELTQLLEPHDCAEHAPAGVDAGRSVTIPTAGKPITLDHYSPPYVGRAY